MRDARCLNLILKGRRYGRCTLCLVCRRQPALGHRHERFELTEAWRRRTPEGFVRCDKENRFVRPLVKPKGRRPAGDMHEPPAYRGELHWGDEYPGQSEYDEESPAFRRRLATETGIE